MSTSNPTALVAGVHAATGHVGANHSIYLYRDKQVCSLPAFPVGRGIRPQCQIASADRVIYVLGGLENRSTALASQDVYALDLTADEAKWRKSSNMNFRRVHFGVGVMNGKIYVFGGCNCGVPVFECEVYDPKKNTWSLLTPMPQSRVNHKVAVLGSQFYLYGGKAYGGTPAYRGSTSTGSTCTGSSSDGGSSSTILVYDPIQAEKWLNWDEPEDLKKGLLVDNVFVLNECFHRLTCDSIDRYDMVEETWTTLHSFVGLWTGRAFYDIPDDLAVGSGGHTILVGDELLTVGHFRCKTDKPISCLLQTVKFGSEEKDIVLEIVQINLGRFEKGSTHIFAVDL